VFVCVCAVRAARSKLSLRVCVHMFGQWCGLACCAVASGSVHTDAYLIRAKRAYAWLCVCLGLDARRCHCVGLWLCVFMLL